MEDREKQIPPPKSWITFEDLCHRLFKAVWNDSLAQKNGRSGQPQNGVDVFGSPGSSYDVYEGIQCKGKNGQYGAKPTVKEIVREIAKAELFQPTLTHWIFATTAAVDATLQETARNISVRRKKKSLFTVSVLGWGEIESLLCKHKEVLREFYSNHGFDYANIIEHIQSLPQGSEIRELANLVREAIYTPKDVAATVAENSAWIPVIFNVKETTKQAQVILAS